MDSQYQKPGSDQSKEETANQEKIPPPQPPPTEPQIDNTKPSGTEAQNKAEEREKEIEERMSAFERSMIRLTRAGVIVGFITFVIFTLQLCEMWIAGNQMQTTSDKIKDALIDANRQNQEAFQKTLAESQKSIDTTIDNSRLDQRAWITVSNIQLSEEPVINKEITATLDVVNTGKTPAIHVVVQSILTLNNTEPSVTFIIPSKITSRSIIAPGNSVMSFTPNTPLIIRTNEQLNKYHNKTDRMYIEAIIRYGDIFNRPHWTKVCFHHAYGLKLGEFTACGKGNEVDDN